jgi:hypothetical protein
MVLASLAEQGKVHIIYDGGRVRPNGAERAPGGPKAGLGSGSTRKGEDMFDVDEGRRDDELP